MDQIWRSCVYLGVLFLSFYERQHIHLARASMRKVSFDDVTTQRGGMTHVYHDDRCY